MSNHVRWKDIRAGYVERAGGEEAVETGRQELLAETAPVRHDWSAWRTGTSAQRAASAVAGSSGSQMGCQSGIWW